jgi:pantoate--beta-alanine ligase
MRIAREKGNCVAISIFVNPLQFNSSSDLECYPRTLDTDCQLAEEVGVDVVFAPTEAEMYPWLQKGKDTRTCRVSAPAIADSLEGAHRPGHFDGVVTVVAALFNIIEPDSSIFGEKDYQQALVIKRLVEELHYRTEIVLGPIIRETDGLAMSSRNALLSSEDRRNAAAISKSLFDVQSEVKKGEFTADSARQRLCQLLSEAPGIGLEYAEIVDIETLEPLKGKFEQAQALVAAQVGNVRLIDNIRL